jgi:plasmid stabilization system protein ParE
MKIYTVITTEFALNDLQSGRAFYDKQASLLGNYFFDTLLTDIESLHFYASIHIQEYGYYKMLSKRFPYAIYYETIDDTARVVAVLDQRRNPMYIYTQLDKR